MYNDVLRRLRDAVSRKRPEKLSTNSWFLSHNNAPAHRSVLVKDFLAENNVTILKHPPHSPHLAPDDFYLFPRLISAFKVRRFCVATDIIKNATDEQKAFTKWLPRMFPTPSESFPKSIVAQGGYFQRNVAEIITMICISQK